MNDLNMLEKLFQRHFGIRLTQIVPLPDIELFSLEGEGLVLGSTMAQKNPYLVQSHINAFINSDYLGYFLIGFWGHGVYSYAFYYARIDEWSKIFFRLAYGGIYMDNEEAAKNVRQFLTNYFAFEPELKSQVKSMVAIDSMGDGDYRLTLLDGRVTSLRTSLYHEADFKEQLGSLILGKR